MNKWDTSKTFVLTANTNDGIRRHDLELFIADNPNTDFIHVDTFRDSLRNMGDGEELATLVHPDEHADFLKEIEHDYGIH